MPARWLFLSVILLSVLRRADGQQPPDAVSSQTLTVDQLSAIHFGERAGRQVAAVSRLARASPVDLAPLRAHAPQHVRAVSQGVRAAGTADARVGWMTADSRYRLTVNGQRVQWGPAPCDPRQLDVDPMDITALLRPGKNVMAVEVLYYGIGEGTWAAGKPGLLFHAVIETPQGEPLRIVSDEFLAMHGRPGASACSTEALVPAGAAGGIRRAPASVGLGHGRVHAGRALDGSHGAVLSARQTAVLQRLLHDRLDRPGSAGRECLACAADSAGREKSMCRSKDWPTSGQVQVEARSAATGSTSACPNSFEIARPAQVEEVSPGTWRLPATAERTGVLATFEFAEQIVGFPYFEIEAPAGTIVELMTQEAHDPQATAWMDNHFYAWSRFICREGVNRFEAFDYESLRWLQLHVRESRSARSSCATWACAAACFPGRMTW